MAIQVNLTTDAGVVLAGGYAVVSRAMFEKTGEGDKIRFVVKVYASKALRDAGCTAVDKCLYAGEFISADNVTAVNKQCYEFLRGRCADVNSYEFELFNVCEEV